MDPNACLARLREALAEGDSEGAREAFASLSEWLSRGGFLPDAWTPAPPPPTALPKPGEPMLGLASGELARSPGAPPRARWGVSVDACGTVTLVVARLAPDGRPKVIRPVSARAIYAGHGSRPRRETNTLGQES